MRDAGVVFFFFEIGLLYVKLQAEMRSGSGDLRLD